MTAGIGQPRDQHARLVRAVLDRSDRASDRTTISGAKLKPLYGPEDFAFHDQHGIEVVRIEVVKEQGTAWVAERFRRLGGGPVYCSFDIDAVDPAFAPGTGTPEVGGLTSYEALVLVRALAELNIIGADVVEVAPQWDGPGQVTALMAANLMFELVSVMALRR